MLLNAILPPVYVEEVSEKLTHFAAHKDDYDTLFIGSSRTYRQLLPSLFDRLMAAGGQPTRTFNAGVDGMFAPEDGYFVEKLFALRPQNLRRVFIEVSRFNSDFAYQPAEAIRCRYWHDRERLVLLLKDALPWKQREKWRDPRRWTSAWEHTQVFLVRGMNLGRGADCVKSWGFPPPPPPPGPPLLGPFNDGANAYLNEAELGGDERARFDADMKERLAGKTQLRALVPSSLENLRHMLALVRAAGIEPVLFNTPTSLTRKNDASQQVRETILDFNLPERWPAFFDPANRNDRAHLNAPGARLFTQAFAEEVLKLPAPAPR